MISYETLVLITKIILIAAAVTTNAFPVFYAFSAWYQSWLGRVLMFHALVFAFALDVNLLFRLHQFESQYFRLGLAFVSYLGIAFATAMLTVLQIMYNRPVYNRPKKRIKENNDVDQ